MLKNIPLNMYEKRTQKWTQEGNCSPNAEAFQHPFQIIYIVKYIVNCFLKFVKTTKQALNIG